MRYINLILMFAIVFLPGCLMQSCSDNGGDETLIMKSHPDTARYRLNESAIFVDLENCVPKTIMAYDRSGNVLDLCSKKAERHALLPPKSIHLASEYVEMIPVEEFIEQNDKLAFLNIIGIQTASEADKLQARQTKQNLIYHTFSTYWGITRRLPHFLNRYKNGTPYPEPNSEAFDIDMNAFTELKAIDIKMGHMVNYAE